MLRNISKTVGSAMAALCLVATLAMAQTQSPSQPMTPQTGNTTPQQGHRQNPSQDQSMTLTCTRDNGKGDCVAAAGADGKEFVVHGEGLEGWEARVILSLMYQPESRRVTGTGSAFTCAITGSNLWVCSASGETITLRLFTMSGALNALDPDSISPFSAAHISSVRTLRAPQD